jgi:RNA polymerase sigma factor (sigma-70 family)
MIADAEALYRSEGARLRRIVGKRVHAPRPVIEDACQHAWSVLVQHAYRLEEETVMAWLATTASREAVRLSRRERRELSLESQIKRSDDPGIPDRAPSPQQRAEWQEQLARVAQLPRGQQRLLWLRALGFSYEEIAARCDLTVRTIDRQIYRARRRLTTAA